MTNPIGVRLGKATRILVERRAEVEGKTICQYMRDVIQKSIDLPDGLKEGNRVAELVLKIERLEKENMRLRYEGNFNQVAFESENIEIVQPMYIEVARKIEQVA